MYKWRQLAGEQRRQVLAGRQKNLRPWHSPPRFSSDGRHGFHLAAACYEHFPAIGTTPFRMAAFEESLIGILSAKGCRLHAWCVLPNHWHALVRTENLKAVVAEIGQLHGKTSFQWNGEDGKRGRKCWHGCADRRIRTDRHFYVARNYIHHNPAKHGYVGKWEDWPYSSAGAYISKAGRDAVAEEWNKYPVLNMGGGWDD